MKLRYRKDSVRKARAPGVYFFGNDCFSLKREYRLCEVTVLRWEIRGADKPSVEGKAPNVSSCLLGLKATLFALGSIGWIEVFDPLKFGGHMTGWVHLFLLDKMHQSVGFCVKPETILGQVHALCSESVMSQPWGLLLLLHIAALSLEKILNRRVPSFFTL